VIPPGLAAGTSWLGSGNLTAKRLFLLPRDVAIFGRPLNYFISSYDRSAASGGSGLAGKSVRKTANVCDPSTTEMNINIAANFLLVAFMKINRLSSFFSEISRPKFSKLLRSCKRGFCAAILALAVLWIYAGFIRWSHRSQT
jgi:hypothetical protein